MAKFATHASGAIWWPYLQPMQVLAKFTTDVRAAKFNPSYGVRCASGNVFLSFHLIPFEAAFLLRKPVQKV